MAGYYVKLGGPWRASAPSKWKKMSEYPGSPYQSKASAEKVARRLARECKVEGMVIQVTRGRSGPAVFEKVCTKRKRRKKR